MFKERLVVTSAPNPPQNKITSSSNRGHPAVDDPLNVISGRHARQREVCQSLKSIAESRLIESDDLHRLKHFFYHELPHHREDEEKCFFPVLRRRVQPERDLNLGSLLERIAMERRKADKLMLETVRSLEALAGDHQGTITAGLASDIGEYHASEMHRLAITNGVIMTIARARLTRQDISSISHCMTARAAQG
jgi:inactivated superfamily I helicase